mmetsp:Transcript_23305/g.44186  ORF Transcript_23305/g.44186 Transcript_23305/m.44186 type:complete len:769 (+) Transcript_23305:3945-6251(+)|eukprot:CAMPEP_0201680938 /NCGR_PEP_ID=MMETSP0494-20130426/50854_1 /ASSEMBLY_ACC=CAM_ASM_000839 /TAXON_ID=420259 /ORGANISM="Thalassiosira gravida, Strain GMp14c1" /LENGTH=768 /DNA_ID=CAMNT_0048164669 /DNA_START=4946 /DNA_END=7252 /DNA_ORIENTATION=-
MEEQECMLDPLINHPEKMSTESIPSAAPSSAMTQNNHHDYDANRPPPTHHPTIMMEQVETPPPEHHHQSCLTLLRNAIRNPDQLTAMISNYSTSYNAVNVGIVLPVLNYSMQLKEDAGGSSSSSEPSSSSMTDFYGTSSPYGAVSSIARRLEDENNNNNSSNNEEDDEQESLVASSLLAGMVFGQLIGGFLGDVLGRRNAMLFVMILQIGGSLGSAFFISTNNNDVEGGLTTLEQLAIWRFILGIGAGGVYPLAAVMSAENNMEDCSEVEEDGDGTMAVNGVVPQSNNDGTMEQEWNDKEDRCHRTENSSPNNVGYAPAAARSSTKNSDSTIQSFQRIALTFSTQGLGFITVPLVAYPMLWWNMDADVIWRALLGMGALPGVLVLYLRLCSGNGYAGRHSKRNGIREVLDAIDRQQSSGNTVVNGVGSDEDDVASLELPKSNIRHVNNNGGNTTDEANPTMHEAVSTLFNDVTSSDSNGAIVDLHQNELAFVENSLLDNVGDDNEKRAENEDDSGMDSSPTPIRNQSRGLWESIKAEPNLGRKFAGTAGIWFLFDVTFYGNTLFEPLVLEAAFGSHSANASNGYELLETTVRDSLVISLLSLPGYFVTVFLIGRRTCVCRSIRSSSSSTRCGSASCFTCEQTPVYIQMQGFFCMSLLYIIIGLFWDFLSDIQWLLLVLYAGTFFFANYGPNTTTFLLPSVTYSEECRSTLNGISAAAGKVGALVGASVFEPAADMWGENVIMMCCGCVSLLAFVLTKVCLGRGGSCCR